MFSIIIPVYNRPKELDELLQSIAKQQYDAMFEVIVIEDGSDLKSDTVVEEFKSFLNIQYHFKENSGPGDSRNYGMKKAKGDYFVILDSDCILPNNYLKVVQHSLEQYYCDAYGGPDTSHPSFSDRQIAINYSMTSLLTTGGIRGSKLSRNKFQLRSFNMGISKKAFDISGGFSNQQFGEDIDLTFKLWDHHFKTTLIPDAYVYHKRRATWKQFFKQTFNFGAARPILNEMHPKSAKITYWFPSIFIIGLLLVVLGWVFNSTLLLVVYIMYLCAILIHSLVLNKNLMVAFLSVYATLVQFSGYGIGFLRSVLRLKIQKHNKEKTFPEMFS